MLDVICSNSFDYGVPLHSSPDFWHAFKHPFCTGWILTGTLHHQAGIFNSTPTPTCRKESGVKITSSSSSSLRNHVSSGAVSFFPDFCWGLNLASGQHCGKLSVQYNVMWNTEYNIYINRYIYIYTYLEPQWPLLLEVNPPKQGLLEPKQGSFGFQVCIYIYT